MNRITTIVAGVCFTLLTACMPQSEHRPINPLVVDTFTVQQATTTQFRTFNGQVMPAELTPLAFRLDGEIKSMLVKEGDAVTKGQIIAVLDDSKARQRLVDAQARYELALKQIKRGQGLRINNMISAAELDELSANFRLAKANLGTAQASMEYMRLKAPFDAVVSSVDKKKHENVSPGEQVVSVFKNDLVYVKIEVSDSVFAMLNPKTQVKNYQPVVSFSEHDVSYNVTYLEHTSELHPTSQTYEIWLQMPQVESNILPGTSAKVSVDLAKAGLTSYQAFQIPMTSIDSGIESHDFYIWKLISGKAYRVAINVDQITGDGALVSSGIEEGDVLINSSLRKLREGMEIEGVEQ